MVTLCCRPPPSPPTSPILLMKIISGLVQPTPEISDTLEADIPDEDVVDTMVDDILEEIECENGQICYDSNYRCVE